MYVRLSYAMPPCLTGLAGVRPPWGRAGRGCAYRGRAALTRGYRIVRPPWRRQPRRMHIATMRKRNTPPDIFRTAHHGESMPRRGWMPRAFSGGRKAAPPKATALATGCPRERLRKCPTALCAIWQTVNADVRLRPPFSVGNAAGRGPFVDPSRGFRFPSHGSADPSHGNFDPWALFDRKMALNFAI